MQQNDTICALATAPGIGALAIIRLSGSDTFKIVNQIFKGQNLLEAEANKVYFGKIMAGTEIIDEVLLSVFKNPHSFTKEDSIEISTHGSDYIVKRVLKLLIENGCRLADPGEFTQRAYLNGQFDLAQAEAVADLIAADSAAAHSLAMNQLRGGFSKKLEILRTELINFASLVELELDFGEEDVQFADRKDLEDLIDKIQGQILPLISSFESGNVIKEGLPIAIIGAPNAGKSTLLNTLLQDDKAIVTDIPGTTRDVIEDKLIIEGRKFRIIDTAGIRETEDIIENMGIERSLAAMNSAKMVILLYDSQESYAYLKTLIEKLDSSKTLLWVQNKTDLNTHIINTEHLHISAKNQIGLNALTDKIIEKSSINAQHDIIVSNMRHVEHLSKASEALQDVYHGLQTGITGDFLAQDIRLSLYHLGLITGTISTDDLLANIFGKFCIGK